MESKFELSDRPKSWMAPGDLAAFTEPDHSRISIFVVVDAFAPENEKYWRTPRTKHESIHVQLGADQEPKWLPLSHLSRVDGRSAKVVLLEIIELISADPYLKSDWFVDSSRAPKTIEVRAYGMPAGGLRVIWDRSTEKFVATAHLNSEILGVCGPVSASDQRYDTILDLLAAAIRLS